MEAEPIPDPVRQARMMLADAEQARRRAEVNKAQAILAMIDSWPIPDPLDVDHPATEKLVDIGGARVGEFVTLEVAAVLGISDPAASALVHDVAGLRSRHPLMWTAVQELRVEVWQARKVVTSCRELSVEAALAVDRKLASGWGVLPWSKISKKLPSLIAAADTALARAKARAAQDERYVSIRHNGDSTSWLIARMDTGAALQLQASLGQLTDHLIADGATEPLPLLRAQALEILATPYLPDRQGADSGENAGSAQASGFSPANPSPKLPLADVVVHIQAEDLDPETQAGTLAEVAARGGDVGPVLLPDIAHLLGHFRVRVIPVIDQNADTTVDAYPIPDRMRMSLQLREETSVFPYSSRRSWSCDLDHTEPFRFGTPDTPTPPGQTRISNLGPLSRREHRAKTAGVWKVSQPAAGPVPVDLADRPAIRGDQRPHPPTPRRPGRRPNGERRLRTCSWAVQPRSVIPMLRASSRGLPARPRPYRAARHSSARMPW